MRTLVIVICTLIVFAAFAISGAYAEKWKGVDETVVQKVAEEHGRAPRTPIINTDQGDLLLFVFLGAGTIGGFFAGYFYRKLIAEAPTTDKTESKG